METIMAEICSYFGLEREASLSKVKKLEMDLSYGNHPCKPRAPSFVTATIVSGKPTNNSH